MISFGYTDAGATFDTDRIYRYHLWRGWSGMNRRVLWVMLNPSIADEEILDPTLRRCEGFSKQWGYDGFEVVNLFALRTPYPKELRRHKSPVGPLNDEAIEKAADRAALIVVGWGTETIAITRSQIVEDFCLEGHELWCLGRNDKGSPKHPLFLKASTELVRWGKP